MFCLLRKHHKDYTLCIVFIHHRIILILVITRNKDSPLVLCLVLVCHCQMPHSGRIEQAHNILQQHSSGVHGNPSLCDTGSPLPQRNTNTQNSRLQSEGSFGLGGPGAPGGEGADHALDVSGRLLIMCSII